MDLFLPDVLTYLEDIVFTSGVGVGWGFSNSNTPNVFPHLLLNTIVFTTKQSTSAYVDPIGSAQNIRCAVEASELVLFYRPLV